MAQPPSLPRETVAFWKEVAQRVARFCFMPSYVFELIAADVEREQRGG